MVALEAKKRNSQKRNLKCLVFFVILKVQVRKNRIKENIFQFFFLREGIKIFFTFSFRYYRININYMLKAGYIGLWLLI